MRRRVMRHAVGLCLALGVSVGAPSAALRAQGVRITGTTVTYYFELLPVLEDSIADSLTSGPGVRRESPIGTVSCPEGHTQCYFYRSGERTHTVPLTQDIEVTGWGLGQGVSVYAHVRVGAHLAGETDLWTRANEHFTPLTAYVEMDRSRWTARAGRLWLTSQLGVNNFDGGSLAIRPWTGWTIGGYAGRGLIQGLSESFTNGSLGSVDVLPPDVGAILLGATARYRSTHGFAVGAEYQKDMRSDRAGVYSERVAFDLAGAVAGTSVIGDVQADLATTALNEVRLRVSRPLPRGWSAGLEYLHENPFFPLWTIWGVFAPVGYNEAHADAMWASATNGLSFAFSGGYRQYQDTRTGLSFLPLRDDGWNGVVSGVWRPNPIWEVSGSYRRDIGFGAAKSDGVAGVRWQGDNGAKWLSFTGSAVQDIFEFRVANGYVLGGSVEGGMWMTPDVRATAQVGLYRQIDGTTPSTTVNWSQRVARLRLYWTMGRDPGIKR